MSCPNCRTAMTPLTLDGHYGRAVALDFCHACQAFWFDGHESLQLAPASVLRLFRVVGEAGGEARAQFSHDAACPRCHQPLLVTHDQQRQTTFEYRRCPDGHGRFVSFFNFLREKDFIRPLSKAKLDELRRNLESINCSNCGAPIDLVKATVCAHCGSALSILDVGQAEALIQKLRTGREGETASAAFEHEPGWYGTASSQGLVNAAIGAFTRRFPD